MMEVKKRTLYSLLDMKTARWVSTSFPSVNVDFCELMFLMDLDLRKLINLLMR